MTGFNAKKVPMAQDPDSVINRAEPMAAGTYPARLVQILLLGTQAQRAFKGKEKPPQLMISLTYEFLDEFLKDDKGEDILDKPRWLSERLPFYNLKVDKAASTERYYSFDPEGKADGDWSQLLGAPVMVTVINNAGTGKHEGKIYDNISQTSAMRPKEAAKAPPLVNPTKIFDFYSPDVEIFNSLPDFLKEIMKAALDYEGSELQKALGEKPKAATAFKALDIAADVDDEIKW